MRNDYCIAILALTFALKSSPRTTTIYLDLSLALTLDFAGVCESCYNAGIVVFILLACTLIGLAD